jgi:hypothetical protein
MTVTKLIAQLLKEDQDKEVVIAGYEGGYNPVKSLVCLDVVDNPEKAWYYGIYEQVYDKDTKPQKKVIYLAP